MSPISSHPNIVVEFFGLPGVGKSTLSHRAAAALTSENSHVAEPIRRIDSHTRPHRVLSKARFAIEHHLRHPKGALSTTQSLRAVNPGSTVDGLRVAFNLHYVAGVTIRARLTTNMTLLDQGLYQGIWSVGIRSPTDWPRLLNRFDGVFSRAAPDLVVFVEADTEIIKNRLRSREDGDTRFAPDSPRFDRGVEGYELLKKRLRSDDDAPSSVVVKNETRADLTAGAEQIANAVRSLSD